MQPMQVRIDPHVEAEVKKSLKDHKLIEHVSPGRGKISAAYLVNSVVHQFLKKWNEKNNGN